MNLPCRASGKKIGFSHCFRFKLPSLCEQTAHIPGGFCSEHRSTWRFQPYLSFYTLIPHIFWPDSAKKDNNEIIWSWSRVNFELRSDWMFASRWCLSPMRQRKPNNAVSYAQTPTITFGIRIIFLNAIFYYY